MEHRRLAIVGSYPEGREQIPWGDPLTEIWAFNEAPQKDWWERWDADFQLHAPEVYTSSTNFVAKQIGKDHWAWLQQDHGPDKTIWMRAVDPRVPNGRAYPLDGVLALIPHHYIRSSIAAALGLAIYQGYENIDLYGINLVSNSEYGYQAPNMCYWIGFALGRGVNLTLHCWESEFNQRIYGFEGEVQIEREHFAQRLAEIDLELHPKDSAWRRLKDKLDFAIFDGLFDQAGRLIGDMEQYGMAAGEMEARANEAKRYQSALGDIPRQEFEYTAAKAAADGEILKAKMHHAGGKLEYVWNIWRQTGNLQARDQVRMFAKEKADLAWKTGWQYGINQENVRYLEEFDRRALMAGGQHTLTALGKA